MKFLFIISLQLKWGLHHQQYHSFSHSKLRVLLSCYSSQVYLIKFVSSEVLNVKYCPVVFLNLSFRFNFSHESSREFFALFLCLLPFFGLFPSFFFVCLLLLFGRFGLLRVPLSLVKKAKKDDKAREEVRSGERKDHSWLSVFYFYYLTLFRSYY